MQFSIDVILMTLLVGVITSFSFMSVYFLFIDPVMPVPAFGRVFRFILFENKKSSVDEIAPGDVRSTPAQGLFIGLLAIACMFGLGIATEMASDNFNSNNFVHFARKGLGAPEDTEIRLKSFKKVAEGEIASGRENLVLRRLYTDYIACQAVPKSEPLQDKSTGKDIAKAKDATDADPCSIIVARVKGFYYYAKNSVFFHQTYFDELNKLQSRIDFIRSMSFAFLMLAFFLFSGFVAAIISEILNSAANMKQQPLGRSFSAWWKRQIRGDASYFGHIKNLSEVRLLLLSIASFLIGFAAIHAWAELEYTYDNRVFGYFFCETCRPGDAFNAAPGTPKGQAVSHQGIPDSAYHVFSSPSGHFEPSGLVSLDLVEGRNLFLVASDKDSDHLYLYEVDEFGQLVFRSTIALNRADNAGRMKIEALAVSSDGGATKLPNWIFIAGRHVLKPEDEDDGANSLVFKAELRPGLNAESTGAELDLVPVPGATQICSTVVGKDTPNRCDFEGIAYLGATATSVERLFIGVRSKGWIKSGWRPVLGLVALPLSSTPGKIPQPVVIADARFPDGDGPRCNSAVSSKGEAKGDGKSAYGVSDLTFVNGSDRLPAALIMLSSYEASKGCQSKVSTGKFVSEVQGAVWRVPLSAIDSREAFSKWLDGEPRPVKYLAHKPEGISPLTSDSDTVLIIFDDDAVRKSIDRAPDTFAVNQRESVYLTLKIDDGGGNR